MQEGRQAGASWNRGPNWVAAACPHHAQCSVSTEAGDRLLRRVVSRFDEIEAELTALRELRDKPFGTIRITAGEHPAIAVLQALKGSVTSRAVCNASRRLSPLIMRSS